ncbi:MAG TPA: hypothetical protein VHG35_15820 [Gemmatimonadales bacterium]|nr:hypothetical protein [Gemmatimonadales bacterium]
MYLVELRPGKEELYRTVDDLAAAIRSGEVDGHSRIYHRSTSKWISITLHPQYKAILAQPPAGQPADRSNWTYLTDQAETLKGATDPESPETPSAPESGSGASEASDSPWRRPMTLGISGLFLVLGIQLAFSGPRPTWSASAAQPSRPEIAPAAVEERRSEQVVSLASTSTGWESEEVAEADQPAEAPVESPEAAKAPAALPKAPRLAVKLDASIPGPAASETDARTVDRLLAHYGRAYEAARTRLGSGVRVARLHQLFATTRLTPDGGVTDARLGLAGMANFIRVYREQEGAIEREFQDSFTTMSKDLGWSPKTAKQWYSRETGKESKELASLTDRLVAKIDSVLAVLSAEAGAYKLGDGKIHFEDVTASRQYGELRRSINAAIDSARIAGGEGSAGPMGYLLGAIGSTRLPVES